MANLASAEPTLDFMVTPANSGKITYGGGLSALVGTKIVVSSVVGLDTLVHNQESTACIGCKLNFATSPYSDHTSSEWDFWGTANSWIALTGTLDVDGKPKTLADDIVGNGLHPLFSGHFNDASVLRFGKTFKIVGGEFFDWVNPALAEHYGLAGGPHQLYIGNLNISFSASGAPPAKFSSTRILSGDVANQPVPEPASIALLALALTSLGLKLKSAGAKTRH